eukprot:CAMPEP_0117517272 /NCGR_PEP_ID=MMETSP0784-20121206/31527_1 /TAXON_ID=39447 /ORGANISM="" /LENGTH=270 /DNA_ID=CAMNT_0005313149 /DNA_START=74 /DNA_END=886 /DNA_ORIENTATION=+
MSHLRATFLLLIVAGVPSIVKSQDDAEVLDGSRLEDMLDAHQFSRLHEFMDSNGDGKLSLEEMREYAQQMGKATGSKLVGGMLEHLDTSKDGKLSFEELEGDIKHEGHVTGDEMKELEQHLEVERNKFQAADSSGDAMLDAEELTVFLRPGINSNVLSVAVEAIMRQKDKNGDGSLTPDEFLEVGQLTGWDDGFFSKADTNGDGSLDATELSRLESGHLFVEEVMKEVFQHADKDNDMHVTKEELVAARAKILASGARHKISEWAQHHEL